jgi:hypothetical protein
MIDPLITSVSKHYNTKRAKSQALFQRGEIARINKIVKEDHYHATPTRFKE